MSTETWKARMHTLMAYYKPTIVVLGSIAEMISATYIKGSRGAIEAIPWRIVPSYDLDE